MIDVVGLGPGAFGGRTADAAQALDALIDRIEPILIGFLTVSVGMTLLSVMLPLLGILGAV